MFNLTPTTTITRGEWVAEIYLLASGVRVTIFRSRQEIPDPVDWESVKRVFLQLRAEGFFDQYQGRKMNICFPRRRLPDGDCEFSIISVSPVENED